MTNRILLLLSCAALILMSGCATLSRTECLSGDWEQLGHSDGSRGYRIDRIEEHREACKEYGVAPDIARYKDGREKGLLAYCTPANGYRQGKLGSTYRNVCSADLESGFMRNYHFGFQVYELTRQISEVESKIKAKERELEKADTPKDRRQYMREHIHDLEREKRNLQHLRQTAESMVVF